MHVPVLVDEVVELLQVGRDDDVIDGTVGRGGHAAKLLQKTGPAGRLLGIDRDVDQVRATRELLQPFGPRAVIVQDSFASMVKLAVQHSFTDTAGIVLDLGMSSFHTDSSERGFSFQKEEPLDMRYDARSELTAFEIVNGWQPEAIVKVVQDFGEERFAERITQAIVAARKKQKITTAKELADVVAEAVPSKRQRVHPATKTFQALRIAVNDELGEIERALPQTIATVRSGGRVAIISFHSLEDRLVKTFFKEQKEEGIVETITKKPITPTQAEITRNPRSRSAKLRVCQKL